MGVMRVRDFSTATEVVMMPWDGVRKECGLLHRTPSLYKWNLFFFHLGIQLVILFVVFAQLLVDLDPGQDGGSAIQSDDVQQPDR